MSYLKILQALEPGLYVTFNDSGGAIGQESPELCVQDHSNNSVQEFLQEGTGEWYRVVKREDELVLQYDRDSRHADTPPEWTDYSVVETIEVIAEPKNTAGCECE